MPRQDKRPSQRAQVQAGRAKWAWDVVSQVDNKDGEYLTEARKLPARMLTCGLGQTMAYLFGKYTNKSREKAGGLLLAQLSERVGQLKPAGSTADSAGMMETIVNLDPRKYREVSREMLQTAEWIKRFAEGHIDSKKAVGGGE